MFGLFSWWYGSSNDRENEDEEALELMGGEVWKLARQVKRRVKQRESIFVCPLLDLEICPPVKGIKLATFFPYFIRKFLPKEIQIFKLVSEEQKIYIQGSVPFPPNQGSETVQVDCTNDFSGIWYYFLKDQDMEIQLFHSASPEDVTLRPSRLVITSQGFTYDYSISQSKMTSRIDLERSYLWTFSFSEKEGGVIIKSLQVNSSSENEKIFLEKIDLPPSSQEIDFFSSLIQTDLKRRTG